MELTKEEREFIYGLLNQTLIAGVEHNELKVSVMRKMDVEKVEEKAEEKNSA